MLRLPWAMFPFHVNKGCKLKISYCYSLKLTVRAICAPKRRQAWSVYKQALPVKALSIHGLNAPSGMTLFFKSHRHSQESRLVKQREAVPSPRQAVESKQACAPERDAPRRSLGAGPW